MPPTTIQTTGDVLSTLLTIAWLAPLVGFAIEVFGGTWSGRTKKTAAYLAVFCIGFGFVCSTAALVYWGQQTGWAALSASDHHAAGESGHSDASHAASHAGSSHQDAGHNQEAGRHHDSDDVGSDQHAEQARAEPAGHADGDAHVADTAESEHEEHRAAVPSVFTGTYYVLASYGPLQISLGYYIDSLTLVMFMMVTLIATCIHVFAIGYMSDELTEDHVDHKVHMSDGRHLHRPGRFYLVFSYMSLFSFSMLGLVLADNIFQVFVFWELVGICSYLLIGFYVERHSASTAANKAFIVNRVGDFGFLIGLMVLWTWFGTFHFGPHEVNGATVPGLFDMLRDSQGQIAVDAETNLVTLHDPNADRTIPYTLLVVAGLGVFAGCIGKSAQLPLQTWLPDAMEGPTPVSALVHSATMVAAGVYLAGRFYPMFTVEVLLTIAYVGCITLFLAATIAVVATDIKRVLAFSTISQLGYMMLGIGVAGWGAGLFHLVTHAFFKSLMFLAAGSVIIACHHEQEMPRMGGLIRKLPVTGITMLVGVIAISGLAIPGVIAFSGYHSKDAIIATALSYTQLNPGHFLLFWVPLITAGITAFYMFRLWYYTFWGSPRDQELYDHAHETPLVMTGALVVLALFAAFCAVGGEQGLLYSLLIYSEPAGVATGAVLTTPVLDVALPGHEHVHAAHSTAGMAALLAALLGTVTAYVFYGRRLVDPGEIKRQLAAVHRFLVEKWRFDELYDAMFVRPVHIVAGWCAAIDRNVFDEFLHRVCRVTVDVSRWDRRVDESMVDGFVNLVGDTIFAVGRSLRRVQTGFLRQYIMFIAVGVLTLFVLVFSLFPK